jgi:FkbM family methyltransferase
MHMGQASTTFVETPPMGTSSPTWLQRAVLALAHTTPLGRGSGRRLTTKALLALRDGPIDASLAGQPFRFDIRANSTDRQALIRPSYNAQEFEFLLAGLGAGSTYVDIGANSGFFVVKIAAARKAQCRILAIEPNPAILPSLRLNVASAGDSVTIVDCAVGAEEGIARFHSSASNLGESSFAANGEIEVPVRPLLAIVTTAGLDRIDALKIDVEGFEDQALLPFFAQAPRQLWPRRIVMEFTAAGHWKQDCLTQLLGYGYRETGRTRGNTLLRLDE